MKLVTRTTPILLLAIALFVIVVVFLLFEATSSNVFCGSRHIIREPYRTWSASLHSHVDCVDCHAPLGFFNNIYFKITKGSRELYLNFFGAPELKPGMGRPENVNCLECHHEERPVSSATDIRIAHLRHIRMKGLKCSDCHPLVAHALPGVVTRPAMGTCLECHDGKRASNSCNVCHID